MRAIVFLNHLVASDARGDVRMGENTSRVSVRVPEGASRSRARPRGTPVFIDARPYALARASIMDVIVRFRDGGIRVRATARERRRGGRGPRATTSASSRAPVPRARTVLPAIVTRPPSTAASVKGLFSLRWPRFVRVGRRSSVVRMSSSIGASSSRDIEADVVEAATFEDASATFEDALPAFDDDIEVIHLCGEVVLDSTSPHVGAHDVWRVVKPLLCPRDDEESKRVVQTMSSMLSCARQDVAAPHASETSNVLSSERVRLKQVSKWRHSALIRGKSTTVVDVTPIDDESKLTFDVVTEACEHHSSMTPTLRSYTGETSVVHTDDGALALRMTGLATVSKATSYATRLVRDVMVGAMRSQMETSLEDLQRVVRDAATTNARA